MNPEAPPSIPPEAPIVGYCRACGRALDATSVHTAHGTIYCAEHVPAETIPNGPPVSDSPYASPYTASTPPPVPHPDVSPGVAFVLGLIPGVGAIYNGQYAKGLVHVFIVGMLITLVSGNEVSGFEPLFGMLIPGFWAYMAFEAYHTAKQRQLGKPVDEFSSLIPGHGGGSRFPAAPILLVALGVVFLLNNLEIFELRRMLRFWPVMLIALGLYMLYLRMTGTSSTKGEQ